MAGLFTVSAMCRGQSQICGHPGIEPRHVVQIAEISWFKPFPPRWSLHVALGSVAHLADGAVLRPLLLYDRRGRPYNRQLVAVSGKRLGVAPADWPMRTVSLWTLALLPSTWAFFRPAAPSALSTSRPLTRLYNWEDEDADVRYTMSPKHIDTGFLKREKAAPLYEDPSLLSADTLNEIFGPDEKENIFILRSMWTASCIFRLDGILVDSADLQVRLPPPFQPAWPTGRHVAATLTHQPHVHILKVRSSASCDPGPTQARAWEKVASSVDAPAPSMRQVR